MKSLQPQLGNPMACEPALQSLPPHALFDDQDARHRATVLTRLPGWPAGTAIELWDMASPHAPLFRAPDGMTSSDVLQVWRKDGGYYGERTMMSDLMAPLLLRKGDDAFLEALADELGTTGAWDALLASNPGTQATTWAGWLREAASADAAEALDPIRQRGLDHFVNALCEKDWASQAGDLAPQLVTQLRTWPAGRALEVHGPGFMHSFGQAQPGHEPVRVWLEYSHYTAVLNGQLESVPSDGDCFFHAIAKAMGEKDAHALVGIDTDAEPAVDAETLATFVRWSLASFVLDNPHLVQPWVDLERLGQPSPPPQQRLPDVVPASGSMSDKQMAKAPDTLRVEEALLELLELTRTGRRGVGAQQLEEIATKHDIASTRLERLMSANGVLKLEGHYVLQRRSNRSEKKYLRTVDAPLLRKLQKQAQESTLPGPLNNKRIIELGYEHNVSIFALRTRIARNGDFTRSGQHIVDGTRDRSVAVSAETLLELQKKVRRPDAQRMPLKQLQAMVRPLNVALASVRRAMNLDGSFTEAGARLVQKALDARAAAEKTTPP